MKIAGIDYSITSPALCVLDTDTDEYRFHAFAQTKKQHSNDPRVNLGSYPSWKDNIERYIRLAAFFLPHLKGVDLVVIEGYAFAGKGAVFNIAECTGILKSALYDSGIRYEIVEPTTLKKFATGKGNAKKGDMWTAYAKDPKSLMLPDIIGSEIKDLEKIPGPITDMVDSYWLARYGSSAILKLDKLDSIPD